MENLYLISGDDEIAKEEQLEIIKSRFNKLSKGVNLLYFDKDNIYNIGNELTTYSFFSEPKLLIVKVPKSNRKQEDNEENDESDNKSNWFDDILSEKILDKIDNITLVFVGSENSKSKLYKFVNEYGKVIDCSIKNTNELVNWTIDFCEKNNIKISRNNASYLVDTCGNNKQFVKNELIKLFNYIDSSEITREDIDIMCIRTPETIVFNLTDGMGQKNVAYSLKMLDELINNKEPIQKILVLLTRHFKSLLLTKVCLEDGRNVQKTLGINPYPATKYSTQSKNFTKGELVQIFKALAQLDIDSKVGNADLKIGIQKIIMQNN